MFKRAVIAAAVGLACFGAVSSLSGVTPDHDQAKARNTPTAQGLNQLEGVTGLDLEAGRIAVMLHSLATGGAPRVVVDPEAIRNAQTIAVDGTGASEHIEKQRLLAAVLSAPGQPPENSVITIIRDKEPVDTYTCEIALCPQQASNETLFLTKLREASLPLRFVQEEFGHHEQARAAHFKALRNQDVVFIYPPDLPSPSTIVYPNRMQLNLPAVLREIDPITGAPTVPFDEAEYTARFTVAFAHAFPDAEAYRLGDIAFSTLLPGPPGWPVLSDEIDSAGKDDTGMHWIDGVHIIAPQVSVEVIPALAETLLGPHPFHKMPAFTRMPDNLTARLDTMAEETLGHPCPGCFQIALPASVTDRIEVEEQAPLPFVLSYYKVDRDEPSAQQ